MRVLLREKSKGERLSKILFLPRHFSRGSTFEMVEVFRISRLKYLKNPKCWMRGKSRRDIEVQFYDSISLLIRS